MVVGVLTGALQASKEINAGSTMLLSTFTVVVLASVRLFISSQAYLKK